MQTSQKINGDCYLLFRLSCSKTDIVLHIEESMNDADIDVAEERGGTNVGPRLVYCQ